ncbi:MAG: NADH-quinone oxidoreductase subunit C [Candidatus Bathyarchaeia archaeon]
MPSILEAVEELERKLGEAFQGFKEVRQGRIIVDIDRSRVREGIQLILDRFGARLSTISAVDLGLDLELLYHISIGGAYLNLRVKIPKEDLAIDSIANIVPGASWIEREIMDLFGVEFKRHPDPRSLLLPFEWDEGAPLRGPMKGIVNPYQKPGVETILKSGLMFPLSSLAERRRRILGLNGRPGVTATQPEALKEFEELVRKLGFDGKVGYDWRKGKLRY